MAGKVNTKVTLPSGKKGVITTPPTGAKGKETQEVWVKHGESYRVPAKDL